jgi:hypothetical protein
VYWSKLDWGFLVSRGLLIETNPPFYYVLLKAWCLLFGSGETSVRLLSVLVSTLAVLALYALGARLGGRAVGLISAAAFAVSPLQIHYAYEVRAYALLPLLFIVTCIGIAAILEPHPPSSTTRSGGLIGYVSGAVCMVYSHATMIVPLFSLFALTAFELRTRRADLYRFLALNLLLGLLLIPEAIAILDQLHSPNLVAMPPFNAAALLTMLGDLVMGPTAGHLYSGKAPLLAVAFLLLLALHLWRRTLGPAGRTIILCPVISIALIATTSLLVRPIFVSRMFTWVTVPLCLSLGCAAGLPPSRFRQWAVPVVAFAALSLVGARIEGRAGGLSRQPWDRLVHNQAAEFDAATFILVGPSTTPLGILYYGDASYSTKLRRWVDTPDTEGRISTLWLYQALGVQGFSDDLVASHLRDGNRVALVAEADESSFLAKAMKFTPTSVKQMLVYPRLWLLTW